jgi:hypothetical protein
MRTFGEGIAATRTLVVRATSWPIGKCHEKGPELAAPALDHALFDAIRRRAATRPSAG